MERVKVAGGRGDVMLGVSSGKKVAEPKRNLAVVCLFACMGVACRHVSFENTQGLQLICRDCHPSPILLLERRVAGVISCMKKDPNQLLGT